MRRLAACASLALALVACGGGEQSPPVATAPAEPTKTQLAAQKLLDQLQAETGDCDCTGEARAKERIANGKAVQPTGSVVLAP